MSDLITFLFAGTGAIIVVLIAVKLLFGNNLTSLDFKLSPKDGIGFGLKKSDEQMNPNPQQYSARPVAQRQFEQGTKNNPVSSLSFWLKWIGLSFGGFFILSLLLMGMGITFDDVSDFAILGGLIGILQCLMLQQYVRGSFFWITMITTNVFIFSLAQSIFDTTKSDFYTLSVLSIVLFIGPFLVYKIHSQD